MTEYFVYYKIKRHDGISGPMRLFPGRTHTERAVFQLSIGTESPGEGADPDEDHTDSGSFGPAGVCGSLDKSRIDTSGGTKNHENIYGESG